MTYNINTIILILTKNYFMESSSTKLLIIHWCFLYEEANTFAKIIRRKQSAHIMSTSWIHIIGKHSRSNSQLVLFLSIQLKGKIYSDWLTWPANCGCRIVENDEPFLQNANRCNARDNDAEINQFIETR